MIVIVSAWLLVVLGCTAVDSGPGNSLAGRPARESDRAFFERLIRQHHQAVFAAHQAAGPELGPFQPGVLVDVRMPQARTRIPEPVLTAVDYYFEHVERPDWGSVRLYRAADPSLLRPLWIVWVRTDGDDGWVELFEASGLPVGAGRTYLELVAWGQTDAVRSFVTTSGYPEALADRASRTLWSQKP